MWMLLFFIFNLFLLQQIYVSASDFVAAAVVFIVFISSAYPFTNVCVCSSGGCLFVWWCAPSASIACGFHSSIYDIRPNTHTKCEIKLNQISTHFSNLLYARVCVYESVWGMHIARMHISLYVRQRMYNSKSMLPIGQVFFIASSKLLYAFFCTAPSRCYHQFSFS